MADRVILLRSGGVTSTDGLTHAVQLPPRTVVGNLLVAVLAASSGTAMTAPGWTAVSSTGTGIFYRTATGSDALTVTTSVADTLTANTFEISGPGDVVPDNRLTFNGGASTTPEPVHISPVAGFTDYLLIAPAGVGAGPTVYTVAPATDGPPPTAALVVTRETSQPATTFNPDATALNAGLITTAPVATKAVDVQAPLGGPLGVVVEPAPVAADHRVSLTPADVTADVTLLSVKSIVHLAAIDVVLDPPPVRVADLLPIDVLDVVVELQRLTAAGTNLAPLSVVVDVLPVQVSFGSNVIEASRREAGPVVLGSTTRVIAQAILSGRWLHWDLPVSDLEITWTLSGPTMITGVLEPEMRDLADAGLEAWGTWIHVEDSGLIRASGILQPTTLDGERRILEAVGPSAYAAKVPYRSTYSQIGVDPADIVRHLWDHVQSYPRGNLGVQVHGSTPIRLGTEPAVQVEFTTGAGEDVAFERGGPYQLNWFENTFCGEEINSLSGETPFDYLERAQWNADKTDVEHHIDITYLRVGRKLTDTRFAQGENILESAPLEEPDGVYADQVYVQGKGEGADAITASAATTVGGRLRMPAVFEDKTIASKTRARATASEQLAARLASLVEMSEIAVEAQHPNAPLGTYRPGDEIYPQLTLPYLGDYAAWHRITTFRYMAERDAVVIGLTRRAEFLDR